VLGSGIVYTGLCVAIIGLVSLVKPIRLTGLRTRRHALTAAAGGVAVTLAGLALPARESRVARPRTLLDAQLPAWQFREFHRTAVHASPEQTYEAIGRVKADEISLFHALTWIRRGGRRAPESILNAGNRKPIIDVATENGFVRLAEDAPRELVIGTVVVAPPGARGGLAPGELFRGPLPDGFAVAAMNFRVTPVAGGGSIVETETRVYASGASARRRFAAYWRTIYPGSALIRRMWLRAIRKRAEGSQALLTWAHTMRGRALLACLDPAPRDTRCEPGEPMAEPNRSDIRSSYLHARLERALAQVQEQRQAERHADDESSRNGGPEMPDVGPAPFEVDEHPQNQCRHDDVSAEEPASRRREQLLQEQAKIQPVLTKEL
jgi:hypothetical protein